MMELGSETPIAKKTEDLAHMLVHAASPSVASGVESSVHLSNKLPQSKMRANNEDLSLNKSSHKTNFDDSADVYESGHNNNNLSKIKT